jgi:LysR family transcriptional activator of nhaA
MDWLNYHHLLYFWTVAREGGLVPAGRVLRLSHPTLSAQVRALEARLGVKLFAKVGRRLVLTEQGRVAYRYAEEIFSLGREMVDAVEGREAGHPLRLHVGVSDAVPKAVVRQLLRPALELPQPVRLVCRESSYERLLAELAQHALDVLVTDAPVPAGSSVRAFHHLLGESEVAFFGTPALVRSHRRGFPQSLDGAPVLLPLEGQPLRRALDGWLSRLGIRPRVVGEFEDGALMAAMGAEGRGLFPAPAVVSRAVCAQHAVQRVGLAAEVRERFYVVTAERTLRHPAVVALTDAARARLTTGTER